MHAPEVLLSAADIRDALRARPSLAPLHAAPRTVPIIGGGPAGMSCALWLKNFGLRPVLIEKETELGGMQRRSPYRNDWLLGQAGNFARENAAKFERHVRQAGVEVFSATRATSLRRLPGGLFETSVSSRDGARRHFVSAAIVIAMGTEFRGREWIDAVVNAPEILRRGQLHVGPACVGERGADLGAEVLIVGGGDNSFDIAHRLAERGTRVSLAVRSARPRAQSQLQARLAKFQRSGRVEILAPATVRALVPSGNRVVAILSAGAPIGIDNVVLTLGFTPNSTGVLEDLGLQRDACGYLCVDSNAETSCPGTFAVGDVANPDHPCTATAIAAGTVAARAIRTRIEALDESAARLIESRRQDRLNSPLESPPAKRKAS